MKTVNYFSAVQHGWEVREAIKVTPIATVAELLECDKFKKVKTAVVMDREEKALKAYEADGNFISGYQTEDGERAWYLIRVRTSDGLSNLYNLMEVNYGGACISSAPAPLCEIKDGEIVRYKASIKKEMINQECRNMAKQGIHLTMITD